MCWPVYKLLRCITSCPYIIPCAFCFICISVEPRTRFQVVNDTFRVLDTLLYIALVFPQQLADRGSHGLNSMQGLVFSSGSPAEKRFREVLARVFEFSLFNFFMSKIFHGFYRGNRVCLQILVYLCFRFFGSPEGHFRYTTTFSREYSTSVLNSLVFIFWVPRKAILGTQRHFLENTVLQY